MFSCFAGGLKCTPMGGPEKKNDKRYSQDIQRRYRASFGEDVFPAF